MITVYIWKNTAQTGHVALSTDKYYRSLHPDCIQFPLIDTINLALLMTGVEYDASWSYSYQDDVRRKEYHPEKIEIYGADENELNEYIRTWLERDYTKYNLYSSNCCIAVAHMLMTAYFGYLHLHGDWQTIMHDLFCGDVLFERKESPDNTQSLERAFLEFKKSMEILSEGARLTRHAFVAHLTKVFYSHMTLTPHEVGQMARKMRNLIAKHQQNKISS